MAARAKLTIVRGAASYLAFEPPTEALPAKEAAAKFAAWMRETREWPSQPTRSISYNILVALYHDFCAVHSLSVSGENFMLAELAKLPGILRVVADEVRGGKRRRPVRWFITAAPERKRAPKLRKAA